MYISSKDLDLKITQTFQHVGYLRATYAQLVLVFGKPKQGPNNYINNSSCQWTLEFNKKTLATIYDFNTPNTPMNAYEWLVGGSGKDALNCVLDYFNSKEEMLNQSLTNQSLHSLNNKKKI